MNRMPKAPAAIPMMMNNQQRRRDGRLVAHDAARRIASRVGGGRGRKGAPREVLVPAKLKDPQFAGKPFSSDLSSRSTPA